MSNIGALFSGQDNGIVQAAEVPLFSQKYNATDTAIILSKEYPPVPLHLRHRFQYLPACQHLPACESFNKPTIPAKHTPAGHTTRAGKDSHNIMIVIIIIISIRLRYILKNTHKNTV